MALSFFLRLAAQEVHQKRLITIGGKASIKALHQHLDPGNDSGQLNAGQQPLTGGKELFLLLNGISDVLPDLQIEQVVQK